MNGCEAGRKASGGRARHASRQRERFLPILFAAFPLALPSLLPSLSLYLFLYQLALIASLSPPPS